MVTNSLQSFLNSHAVKLIRRQKLKRLRGALEEVDTLFDDILRLLGGGESKAQLNQDIFALMENGGKRNGFFVEFGASDGIFGSNTFLLEKSFGWHGILAEPAKIWHDKLLKNRKANIEFDCVWSKTGETLSFDMTEIAALSTISSFSDSDFWSKKRKVKDCYDVNTISLNDLLMKYNSPKIVDYLSIDTEGSEYDILSGFDFSKYVFNVITVEHNHVAAKREEIHSLLVANGYVRRFEYLTQWDDWYVRAER